MIEQVTLWAGIACLAAGIVLLHLARQRFNDATETLRRVIIAQNAAIEMNAETIAMRQAMIDEALRQP